MCDNFLTKRQLKDVKVL